VNKNKNKPPYDAREIANFLLDLADSEQSPLTIMKLLKLIFLAHAASLQTHAQPLIRNKIQAWKHGPVIPVVYGSFKEAKANPIGTRATIPDILSGSETTAKYDFDQISEDLIRHTYNSFKNQTAFDLSRITHIEGWAWDRIWNSNDVTVGMIISDEDILTHHFSEKKVEQNS